MSHIPSRSIIFYDGACPLCSKEINHYKRLDKQQKIDWCDISTDSGQEKLATYNLDWQGAMKHMHAIDRQGKMIRGAYVFKEMWQQLPFYRWPGKLLSIPFLTPILDQAYKVFAYFRWQSRKKACCEGGCSVSNANRNN